MANWFLLLCVLQDPLQDPGSGWKGFAAGSWVKIRTTTSLDGGIDSESRMTLVEIRGDRLVLEVETSALREIRKERREFASAADRKGPKPRIRELQRGEEDVDVAGRKLKCKWVESEIESEEAGVVTKSTVRVWTSDEIPGRVARMRARVLQPTPMDLEMQAVEYEKK